MAAAALAGAAPGPATGPLEIVACAPGYPGSTQQAASTMAAFAAGLEKAAGLPAGSLTAVYFETESAGLARLKGTAPGATGTNAAAPSASAGASAAAVPAFALVPLPFFLEHEKELQLDAKLQVEALPGQQAPGHGASSGSSGAGSSTAGGTAPPAAPGSPAHGETTEVWSLVAKKGRLHAASDLDGWEIAGLPGYSPAFVRGVVLSRWGAPPPSARVVFSARILTLLRRAASGESVAVIADRSQAASLAGLPFGGDLEVVHAGPPVPGVLLCTVGRNAGATEARVLDAFRTLERAPSGSDVLASMRLVRFAPLDAPGLARARVAWRAGGNSGAASGAPSKVVGRVLLESR